MNIKKQQVQRPLLALSALALIAGTAAPALLGLGQASAAQLTNRSIQLSDSAPSGGSIASGIGSGTSVSYKVTFTTSAAMQSIVIDFCDGSPLIEDPSAGSCDAVTGLNTASAAADGGWTDVSAASQVKLTHGSSQTAGTHTITLSGITNPTITDSFYARITTYTDAAYGAGDPYVSPANAGGFVDYGGVAMSTVTPISVTARVMETMELCTSAAAPTLGCAGVTAPSIVLGHGANDVLDYTAIDSENIYSQITTNATNGYAIYLRSRYTCGGLSKDAGVSCPIPAINAGAAAATTMVPGTAAFGVSVSDGVAAAGGISANDAVTRWKPVAGDYIMDTTSANDGVDDTYGSKVVDSTAEAIKQAYGVNNTYTFAATAAPTTPAGIYTQNFLLVGVGTF